MNTMWMINREESAGCAARSLQPIMLVTTVAFLSLFGIQACRGAGEGVEDESVWNIRRSEMVALLRDYYGITNGTILSAMGKVRRHLFIPEKHRRLNLAYADTPCSIGYGQTISQPYIVAYMTQCLKLTAGEKVLEIGTGSGYQAAVLAECGAEVYSIEIVPELAKHAETVLKAEGYGEKVKVLAGDGYKGWPEHALFDDIIVTCAPEEIPRALVEQLKEGGRMILPLGGAGVQRLVILTKRAGKVEMKNDLPVRFVPMVHGAGL